MAEAPAAVAESGNLGPAAFFANLSRNLLVVALVSAPMMMAARCSHVTAALRSDASYCRGLHNGFMRSAFPPGRVCQINHLKPGPLQPMQKPGFFSFSSWRPPPWPPIPFAARQRADTAIDRAPCCQAALRSSGAHVLEF